VDDDPTPKFSQAAGVSSQPTVTKLPPERLSPYFLFAAFIHLLAIATRFDTLAAKLPDVVAPAVMASQFPLLLLSGYFESRLDYGEPSPGLPKWMSIRSKPVKLAFTFGFIYLALIPLQTWNVSIGPLDPTPPESFPQAQRAMWFAMFSVGMFFPFYMAATATLIPVLRVLSWPLRQLPTVLAALLALTVGFALGTLILALTTEQAVGDFVRALAAAYKANPALGVAISAVMTLGPMALAVLRGKT
jgi:hypothetical protein